MSNIVSQLQNQAVNFLSNHYLLVNGISIFPKEIEVYYFQKGQYEDKSVHRNELQLNNQNHFYIHRWGKGKDDSYKGGNYPGIDFVISHDDSCYFTYLLRSVVIGNGEPVSGPNKVLHAIKDAVGADEKTLESMVIQVVETDSCNEILSSERINLGKTVPDEYRNAMLRFVVLDKYYRAAKYPLKEKMITCNLLQKLQEKRITKEEAIALAKENLGYLPKLLK